MKNKSLYKNKKKVSTAILMGVLTLMLTGCVSEQENTNLARLSDNNDVVAEVNSSEIDNLNELNDGEYEVYVSLTGGSGKANIASPTTALSKAGEVTLTIEWSSPNYDYMIVESEKYLPVNDSGNSIFLIPVDGLDGEISVIADTVAMGTPHEIEYVISYSSENNTDYGGIKNELGTSNKEILNSNISERNINDWRNNHTVTGKLEREYAERFGVTYYDDKYCMVVINESDYYMLNGEGFSVPPDAPEGVTIINVPLKNIDLVSQSTVDYFACLDALDSVSFSSISKKNVQDEKILELMEQKKIEYAGKYSAPDYELLLSGGCSLVVENTMITHTPDVLDQLHNIGISTFIDYSSHEPSPIGRMEWIKLYGLLNGKLDIAQDIFKEKKNELNNTFENNNKKVAYFYVSENGGIGIRKNQDYIVKLIEIAGGEYAFDGLDEYNGTGQMTIQKEAFYNEISDCDVLIYNSTINGAVSSKDELISKCEVLRNTKAYKDDKIYCTNDNIYLYVMDFPEIANELNSLLCEKDTDEYFYKLK